MGPKSLTLFIGKIINIYVYMLTIEINRREKKKEEKWPKNEPRKRTKRDHQTQDTYFVSFLNDSHTIQNLITLFSVKNQKVILDFTQSILILTVGSSNIISKSRIKNI